MFVPLGLSSALRILTVCHCYRKNEKVIRIISARKANRNEQKQYMRKEYDFSKSVKNPYAKHLKKQVPLRLGVDVIDYFKKIG